MKKIDMKLTLYRPVNVPMQRGWLFFCGESVESSWWLAHHIFWWRRTFTATPATWPRVIALPCHVILGTCRHIATQRCCWLASHFYIYTNVFHQMPLRADVEQSRVFRRLNDCVSMTNEGKWPYASGSFVLPVTIAANKWIGLVQFNRRINL